MLRDERVLNGAELARPRLVTLLGLPGSGKTTLAKQLEPTIPAIRYCPDELMVVHGISLFDSARRAEIQQYFLQLARRSLAAGQSVVLEFAGWRRSEREEIRLGAKALGADVELRYLEASLDELMKRMKLRHQQDPTGSMLTSGPLLKE